MGKNITILYPILHYPPVIGGLEQWSQNIAEGQSPDIETLIVTGRVRGEPSFEKKGNVTILRTSLFALSNLSYSSPIYIATAMPFIFLRSLFLSNDVHAFHCHGFISATLGYLLSSISHKPYICTEQSIKLRNPVSKLLSRVVYGKAALCIASSNAVVEKFKKIGVKKIEIIPNGVDPNLFTSEDKSPTKKHGFVILSVGRLEKVKGHKYLVEAFADVKKDIPNARLILVGDGSERKNLKKQANNFGVAGGVEFAGEIPHNELHHWYHKADVFVMPSLSEGFGITAIEAMAAGLPIVATRVGSLPEIISHRETGILIDSKSSMQIRDAVVEISNNKSFAENLADNARIDAERFDWQKSAEQVSRIYYQLTA